MFKKIILIGSCIVSSCLTMPASNEGYLPSYRYADELKETLASLKTEKAMLLKGFEFSLEKGILLCSPMLLYRFLMLISKLGNFRIEKTAYYVAYGFDLMIAYNILARVIRFAFVLSDIKAIEQELDNLPFGLDNQQQYIYKISLTDQDFNTKRISPICLPKKSPYV